MTDIDAPYSTSAEPRLTFGIYPGGVAGTETGLATGPPDDPARIKDALAELQNGNKTLLVRGYIHYTGALMLSAEGDIQHPENVMQYATNGRKVDLVLCFHDPGNDLAGWLNFIRGTVRRHGPQLAKIQITEEPNLYTAPGSADGCRPNVRQALVQGVIAAKDEARRQGYDFHVGFNAVPSFDPGDDFWPDIARLGQQSFREALDYVGLDCFPDVFRPVAADGSPGDLRQSVIFLLDRFRHTNLVAGEIHNSIPIHITENGWPTGTARSAERQASVIETIVHTIYEQATNYNVSHYELFALRDADSSNPDLFHQFGLLRDDYTPKPAFETYRRLIAEYGRTI